MDRYYREYNANVHRGVYTIAEEATAAFEAARAKVAGVRQRARTAHEIVYVRNATEAINLVAYSWARANLREGDAIVLTQMEHHANVVPWHILAAERGVELRWIPLTDDYRLDLTELDRAARRRQAARRSARCRTCSAPSTTSARSPTPPTPPARTCSSTRARPCPHLAVDVQAWDADFVAFSAHKMCGPTGIGALWARRRAARGHAAVHGRRRDDHPGHHRRLHAQRGAVEVRGGHAADRRGGRVRRRGRLPHGARAWTPSASTRSRSPGTRSTRSQRRFGDNLTIYGPRDTSVRGGAISFLFEGIHAHDISQVVDEEAVCVRAGHHCAKPLMRVLGVPATTRASFYVYNDEADADALIDALARAEKFFAI